MNQFHVKLTKKCLYLSEFFGIKSKTGWWFHGWNWHKIMKPPDSVGKKNWNWRHLALPRPSVSFFFPIESGRFQNFSQFHPWNHSQFHFWAKKYSDFCRKQASNASQFNFGFCRISIKYHLKFQLHFCGWQRFFYYGEPHRPSWYISQYCVDKFIFPGNMDADIIRWLFYYANQSSKSPNVLNIVILRVPFWMWSPPTPTFSSEADKSHYGTLCPHPLFLYKKESGFSMKGSVTLFLSYFLIHNTKKLDGVYYLMLGGFSESSIIFHTFS